MTTLSVCSVNVLFESYYKKYCKGDVMPSDERLARFSDWAMEKITKYDCIGMQEWPYSGETADAWNKVLDQCREKWGVQILRDTNCKQAGLLSIISAECEVLDHRVFPTGRGKSFSQTMIKKGKDIIGVINAHVAWARNKTFAFENVSLIFKNVTTVTPHWVAVGDWNTEATTPKDVAMFQELALPDGFKDLTTDFPNTCAADSGPSKIDYIVISPSIIPRFTSSYPHVMAAVKHSVKYPKPHYSSWFSDHVAVEATLEIPEQL